MWQRGLRIWRCHSSSLVYPGVALERKKKVIIKGSRKFILKYSVLDVYASVSFRGTHSLAAEKETESSTAEVLV